MTADPRAALTTLVSAFERHLEACSARHGDDDPSVLAAADDLADAFEAYDDALLSACGEMTPLEVYGDDDEDEDEDDDLEFDDDEDEAGDGEEGEGDELDDHADEDDDEATYSGFDGDFEYEGADPPQGAGGSGQDDLRG